MPKMPRPEDQTASFMMFGLGKFSSDPFIPTKFVEKHRQVAEQASMKLETDAGKRWDVKIKKDKNEVYCMKEGWSEFMKDNEVDDMDFFIFRLVGDSTFNVKIYRCDCCLKDPSSPTSSEGDGEDEIMSESDDSERGRGRNDPLYFEKPLKMHQKSRITLPHDFSKAANMKEKRHVRMEFLPTHRRETVVVDPQPQVNRFDLTEGWPEFREANKLEYEKIYSFEFKPNENAIHVKEVKKGK